MTSPSTLGGLLFAAALFVLPDAARSSETAVPFESVELIPLTSRATIEPVGLDGWDMPDLDTRTQLLGDVWGLRTKLGDAGVTANLYTTQYYQGVTSGGLNETFEYGGRNDYYVHADGAKLGLWPGFLIDLHGETRYGEATNDDVGAIGAPNPALLFPLPGETITALTNVTFTQILSPHLAVFGGKINTLDAYSHPFAAGRGTSQFMNLSFAFPPILARTIPYSALGAGVSVLRGTESVFDFVVLSAGDEPNRSGFEDFFGEGVSMLAKATLPVSIAGRPGHHQLYGAWSNRSVTALDQTDYLQNIDMPGVMAAVKTSSWAFHYNVDQYLYVDPCNPQRGWGVFAQASISDGDPNPIRWFASAGVGGSSPLRSRPLDTFGVAYYYFQTSTALQQSLTGILPVGNEQGVELYYNIGVTQWFHITPDLQILEPARQDANTAVVTGVRARIDF